MSEAKSDSGWGPIEEWLAKLPFSMPMAFRASADESNSLSDLLVRTGFPRGGFAEALLWLRIGAMDPAHGMVQDATSGLGAYIHGVLHRMEGDWWNSKYWFRQVGDGALVSQITGEIERLAQESVELVGWRPLAPAAFVDACEAVYSQKSNGKSKSKDELRMLEVQASFEWRALWEQAQKKNPR